MAELNDVSSEAWDQPWGWETFFSELVRFLQTSERQYAGANQQYTDYVVDRLAMCTRNVEVLKERLETSLEGADVEVQPVITQIFTRIALGQLSTKWQQHMDELEGRSSSAYQVPLQHASHLRPGRPRFSITKEQLEYLHSLHFSWTEIARILGVSRMTVHRRRAEYGMLSNPSQSVSDSQLTQMVQEVRREMPDVGESMVSGRLRAMGVQVTRERVRLVIRRTDPLNTALR